MLRLMSCRASHFFLISLAIVFSSSFPYSDTKRSKKSTPKVELIEYTPINLSEKCRFFVLFAIIFYNLTLACSNIFSSQTLILISLSLHILINESMIPLS